MKAEQVQYGNWVSGKLIMRVLTVTAVFFVLAVLAFVALPSGAFGVLLRVLMTLGAAASLASYLYFRAAHRALSGEGDGVQDKMVDLLLSQVDWDGNGRALDIGCGSGALTIGLAKKFSGAEVTGIDYWGGAWGYAQRQCESNASAEGVAARTRFERASASKLPFPDESFDLVVSNLTFHEVADSKNKSDVVKEALRVVKTGGRFVFQDLFLMKQTYGDLNDLLAALRATGVKELQFTDTSGAPFIPRLLKLPFMLGTVGIISGTK